MMTQNKLRASVSAFVDTLFAHVAATRIVTSLQDTMARMVLTAVKDVPVSKVCETVDAYFAGVRQEVETRYIDRPEVYGVAMAMDRHDVADALDCGEKSKVVLPTDRAAVDLALAMVSAGSRRSEAKRVALALAMGKDGAVEFAAGRITVKACLKLVPTIGEMTGTNLGGKVAATETDGDDSEGAEGSDKDPAETLRGLLATAMAYATKHGLDVGAMFAEVVVAGKVAK